MLRFVFIGCLGYLLACQTPPREEPSVTDTVSETDLPFTQNGLATASEALHEQLIRDAQRIQQLRGVVHRALDSLYQLKSDEDLLRKIEEHETAYLALAEADEVFINWQNEYSGRFDSLEINSDTAFTTQEKETMQGLMEQLRANIERSESLLSP